MKINQIVKFSTLSVFIMMFTNNIFVLPINTLTEQVNALVKYQDPTANETEYQSDINQATATVKGINTTDVDAAFNTLLTNLSAAAAADPEDTLALLQNGEMFSYENLSQYLSETQLQQLCNTVLTAMEADPSTISSFSRLYATKGLNDSNFENAVSMMDQGIEEGNVGDVVSALNVITSESSNDSMLELIQKEFVDIGSPLSNRLIAKFTPSELAQICTAAKLPNSSISNMYDTAKVFESNVLNLQSAYNDRDVSTMTDILSEMSTANPSLTSSLFENGRSLLDYQSLSNYGFTTQQLSTIVKAAGLETADIVSYVTGNYIGPVNNGGISMGGAGGTNLGGNSAEQEAYNNLSTVVNQIKTNVDGLETAQAALAKTQATISQLQSELSTEGADQDAINAQIAEEQADANAFKDAIDVVTGEADAV